MKLTTAVLLSVCQILFPISNQITKICVPNFEDLREIAYLTPKKKTKMLFHWHVLTRKIEPAAYVKLYHINFDAFEIAMHITKLNCVIKFNYEEVYTHVSCETASMWDCFEHWGMKVFLISDKLSCNSASFTSKDIVPSLGIH